MSDEWVNKVQDKLFDQEIKEDQPDDWQDMPEFVNEANDAYRKIIISFENEADVQEFAKLVRQHITDKTKSLWVPAKIKDNNLWSWIDEK